MGESYSFFNRTCRVEGNQDLQHYIEQTGGTQKKAR